MTGRLTAHTHPAPAAACRPRPPAEFCRAGRNSPGRGHGAGLEVPITGLPGPGDDCGARHPAPAPARCPPARPVGSVS